MNRTNAKILALSLGLVAFAGCGKDEDKSQPAAAPAPQSAPQVGTLSGSAWTSVSEQAECSQTSVRPNQPANGANNLPSCVNGKIQLTVNQDGSYTLVNGPSGQLSPQEFTQVKNAVMGLNNQDLLMNANCASQATGTGTATGTNTSLNTGTNTSLNTGTNTSTNFTTATNTNTSFSTGTGTNSGTNNNVNAPFDQITIALNNGARALVWDSAAQASSARMACMDRTSLSKVSQLRSALTPLVWKYATIPAGGASPAPSGR